MVYQNEFQYEHASTMPSRLSAENQVGLAARSLLYDLGRLAQEFWSVRHGASQVSTFLVPPKTAYEACTIPGLGCLSLR